MKICDFTKPELDKFRKECNFTEIERQCFDLKAKDWTNTKLSLELNVSESTISVIMRRVRTKITKVLNWEV
jgi:transcriptional regulator